VATSHNWNSKYKKICYYLPAHRRVVSVLAYINLLISFRWRSSFLLKPDNDFFAITSFLSRSHIFSIILFFIWRLCWPGKLIILLVSLYSTVDWTGALSSWKIESSGGNYLATTGHTFFSNTFERYDFLLQMPSCPHGCMNRSPGIRRREWKPEGLNTSPINKSVYTLNATMSQYPVCTCRFPRVYNLPLHHANVFLLFGARSRIAFPVTALSSPTARCVCRWRTRLGRPWLNVFVTVENDFWISQGKVATSDRWGGQICKIFMWNFFSGFNIPKIIKIGQFLRSCSRKWTFWGYIVHTSTSIFLGCRLAWSKE